MSAQVGLRCRLLVRCMRSIPGALESFGCLRSGEEGFRGVSVDDGIVNGIRQLDEGVRYLRYVSDDNMKESLEMGSEYPISYSHVDCTLRLAHQLNSPQIGCRTPGPSISKSRQSAMVSLGVVSRQRGR